MTKLLRRFDTPIAVADRASPCDWLSFACVFVRREVLDAVGLLDDAFFMCFEDVEFCRWARRARWSCLHTTGARVVHLRGGSGSVKADRAARRRLPACFYFSRSLYFRRSYGAFGPLLANLCWLAGHAIARFREISGGKDPHACEGEFRDVWIGCFASPPASAPRLTIDARTAAPTHEASR